MSSASNDTDSIGDSQRSAAEHDVRGQIPPKLPGMTAQKLTDRALGRALLARQGLLTPHRSSVVDEAEHIGALQAQHWPALPTALASRMENFSPGDLFSALANKQLVTGQLIRGTLHLVSAREYPEYAATAAESGADDWHRTKA